MSAEHTPRGDPTASLDEVHFADGSLIIYDRRNHEAWIVTDSPVTLSEVDGSAGPESVESGTRRD